MSTFPTTQSKYFFSKKEALARAWRLLKNRFWFLIGVTAVQFLVAFGPDLLSSLLEPEEGILTFTLTIVGFIAQLFVAVGVVWVYLAVVDGKDARVGDLFAHGRFILRMIGASILYGLIVLGGLILLIVPGVIWSIKYGFYLYVIVDEDAGVFDALKQSGLVTKGSKWNLFFFGLLLGLVSFAGFLALGVGVLIATPLVGLALTVAYRTLHSRLQPVVLEQQQSEGAAGVPL